MIYAVYAHAELTFVELDKVFCRPGLVARRRDHWIAIQERLVAEEGWIMDGDLGPYDVGGDR